MGNKLTCWVYPEYSPLSTYEQPLAMGTSAEFTEYALGFLAPLLPISTTRFFGGVGIHCHSVQFAMIMDSALYFVVDDTSRKQYEAAGMLPFSYTTSKGQILVRKYFEVPEEILNDAESLRQWANESLQIAIKTKKSKKK